MDGSVWHLRDHYGVDRRWSPRVRAITGVRTSNASLRRNTYSAYSLYMLVYLNIVACQSHQIWSCHHWLGNPTVYGNNGFHALNDIVSQLFNVSASVMMKNALQVRPSARGPVISDCLVGHGILAIWLGNCTPVTAAGETT